MRWAAWVVAAVMVGIGLSASPVRSQSTGVERLYVFDCGDGQSRWSPGVNVGKPLDVSGNCYLIHHARGYLLWDTGVPDEVATMPNGFSGSPGVSRLASKPYARRAVGERRTGARQY
jgi:N-acyl homoserine lactone hydrolase